MGAAPGQAADQSVPPARPQVSVEAPGESSRSRPDFWVYHTRGTLQGTWEKLSSDTSLEGGPDEIFDHQMQFDSIARKLYIFGGKLYWGSMAIYLGLYEYDLDSRRWSRLFDSNLDSVGAIPSRTGHTMLFDPIERQLIIFAGQRGETYLNDLWIYDIDKREAQCLDKAYGTSGGPDGGFTARGALDSSRREFALLSGLVRDRAPPHETSAKVCPPR